MAGVAVGSAAGAAAGAIGALALFAIPGVGPVIAGGVLGAAIAGGAFGGQAGFFYGGATGLPAGEAWGHTFDALAGGQTCVAVHAGEPGPIDRAVSVLRDASPEHLAIFGSDGHLTEVH